MKSAYVTRYAAMGDHIHASHIPRLLKEHGGFDYVCFEYNIKGKHIYANNPFIDEHIIFETMAPGIGEKPMSYLNKRHEQIMLRRNFTKHIDLLGSIERGYIAMEDMNIYYEGSEDRRKKFGGHNYYDQSSIFAGFPEKVGTNGELYFTDTEYEKVQKIYMERYLDNFVVICNLSGTSKHKLFYNAESIIKSFLSKHPEVVCITMGDEESRQHLDFTGDRIVNRAGGFVLEGERKAMYPFRQSMLMTKYSNLVIGCESGLMVAATLLGAPTVQLMTAASIKNHGGDFENDYSLQSPIECSPCHKGPYEYIGCKKFEYMGERYPACIKFDVQTVLNRMEEVYDDWRTKRQENQLSSV